MQATSGGPLTNPLAGPAALVAQMCWRRAFPGEERQLGALRRWLASLLPECPARDDLASVATELGANALRHTGSGRGGWFAVQISWHGPVVRVAVEDGGGPGEPRVIGNPTGEHGRGLLVVRGLSMGAGVCGDHRGRVVWADIAWTQAGSSAPAPAADGLAANNANNGAQLNHWAPADQAGLGSRFAMLPAVTGHSVNLHRPLLRLPGEAGG
ncbi:MAG TPA: ATP-binding protein [Streptosporangiaceae bacterium]|nr:ATP-binding protein [Streptosporangiaceae bacterium]